MKMQVYIGHAYDVTSGARFASDCMNFTVFLFAICLIKDAKYYVINKILFSEIRI